MLRNRCSLTIRTIFLTGFAFSVARATTLGSIEYGGNEQQLDSRKMQGFLFLSAFTNTLLLIVIIVKFRSSSSKEVIPDLPDRRGEEIPEGVDREQWEEVRRLRQHKMELVIQRASQHRQLADLERQIKEKSNVHKSVEEIQKEAEETVLACDMLAEQTVEAAFAYATPFLVQQQRMQSILDRRVETITDKSKELACEHIKVFENDLRETMEVSNFEESLKDAFSEKVPAMAILVSSLFAAIQIKGALFSNYLALAQSCLFAILSIIAVPVIIIEPCHVGTTFENYVLLWFGADGFANLFCILINIRALQMTQGINARLQSPPPMHDVKDPTEATRHIVDHYLETNSQALAELDAYRESAISELNGYTGIVTLLLLVVGTDLCFNTSSDDCSGLALISLVILRLRVILFLMLVIPLVVINLIFVINRFAGSNLQLTLLDFATAIDVGMGFGVPICSFLMKSLIVRSHKDVLTIQLKRARRKARVLEKKQKQFEEDLKTVEAASAATKVQLEQLRAEKAATEEAKTLEELAKAQEREAIREEAREKARIEAHENARKFFVDVNTKASKHVQKVAEGLERVAEGELVALAQELQNEAQESSQAALQGLSDLADELEDIAEEAATVDVGKQVIQQEEAPQETRETPTSAAASVSQAAAGSEASAKKRRSESQQ